MGRGWEIASLAETCRMLNNNRRVAFKEGIKCLDCTYHKLYFPCFDIQPIHTSIQSCFSAWGLSWCVTEQAEAEMGLVLLLPWRCTLPRAFTEVAGVWLVQTAVSERLHCGQNQKPLYRGLPSLHNRCPFPDTGIVCFN